MHCFYYVKLIYTYILRKQNRIRKKNDRKKWHGKNNYYKNDIVKKSY